MKLVFWGIRGTFPVSGKKNNAYGGHTPCSSITASDGSLIVLDAGTGIIKLGESLLRERKDESLSVHLLLTHFHLDHILGLPFFGPLYSQKVTVIFYSVLDPEKAEKVLGGLMAGKYFPIQFRQTPAIKKFKKILPGEFTIHGVKISSCALNHPQGALAFRLTQKKKSVVLATDTEHPEDGVDEQLAAFVKKTDILVYDATFTPEEYFLGKKGWGHSTWQAGTKLALNAKVKNLFLSHFNPGHPDAQINSILSQAKKEFQKTFGAREGLSVDMDGEEISLMNPKERK